MTRQARRAAQFCAGGAGVDGAGPGGDLFRPASQGPEAAGAAVLTLPGGAMATVTPCWPRRLPCPRPSPGGSVLLWFAGIFARAARLGGGPGENCAAASRAAPFDCGARQTCTAGLWRERPVRFLHRRAHHAEGRRPPVFWAGSGLPGGAAAAEADLQSGASAARRRDQFALWRPDRFSITRRLAGTLLSASSGKMRERPGRRGEPDESARDSGAGALPPGWRGLAGRRPATGGAVGAPPQPRRIPAGKGRPVGLLARHGGGNRCSKISASRRRSSMCREMRHGWKALSSPASPKSCAPTWRRKLPCARAKC